MHCCHHDKFAYNLLQSFVVTNMKQQVDGSEPAGTSEVSPTFSYELQCLRCDWLFQTHTLLFHIEFWSLWQLKWNVTPRPLQPFLSAVTTSRDLLHRRSELHRETIHRWSVSRTNQEERTSENPPPAHMTNCEEQK